MDKSTQYIDSIGLGANLVKMEPDTIYIIFFSIKLKSYYVASICVRRDNSLVILAMLTAADVFNNILNDKSLASYRIVI